MRSAIVSVALLALAHSLAPGVYGAPAVVSDHANSLAVRQNPISIVDTVLDLIRGVLETAPIPSQVAEQLAEQIAQELQGSAPSGVLRRAPSSSNSTSSTSFTPVLPTTTTTTNRVLAVATDRIGTSTVGSTSSASLSTLQVSSTPQTRMRRQLPSVLPTAALSGVLSIVGSQSVPLPVQSVAASALSAALGKPGSATSQSAASESTPSKPVQA